jgi:hypothetical protein
MLMIKREEIILKVWRQYLWIWRILHDHPFLLLEGKKLMFLFVLLVCF